MEQNPYQPPEAELTDPSKSPLPEGSLQSALAGDYEIRIGEIRRAAWRLVKGNKGLFFGAVVALVIAQFVASWIITALGIPNGQDELAAGDLASGYTKSLLSGFLMMPLVAPISAGIAMLSVKRAGGVDASIDELFLYFAILPKLIVLGVISAVLTYVGFALLILPGIYLSVAYAFAVPLMIDKGLSPWESLEASRKSVTHNWFAVFALGVVIYVLGMLLAITIVGFVWAVPFMLLGFGLAYRTIFGFGRQPGPGSAPAAL